jgi:hypothetical protein
MAGIENGDIPESIFESNDGDWSEWLFIMEQTEDWVRDNDDLCTVDELHHHIDVLLAAQIQQNIDSDL